MREKVVPVVWLMLAAVIVGASVGLAARANADTGDAAFIKTLQEFEVPYTSPAAAIDLGWQVCQSFAAGVSSPQVRSNLVANWDMRTSEAVNLIGAAVGAFCPEWEPRLHIPISSGVGVVLR